MVARNPRGLMSPVALVVVPVPERGRADGLKAAKILESLALLGRGMQDSQDKRALVSKKMDELRKFDSKIESQLQSHAMRYATLYYRENDPEMKEQFRVNMLLTLAIYTTESLKLMHKKTLEMDDSGVSALFEKALDEAASFLTDRYFSMGFREAVLNFQSIHPFLVSSLHACGMEGRVHTVPGTFEVHRHETLRRLKGAIEAIEAQEAERAVDFK